jgi:hypothetical protein
VLVIVEFDPEGDQYLIAGCLHPMAADTSQEAKPNIIDATLTFVFRMEYHLC